MLPRRPNNNNDKKRAATKSSAKAVAPKNSRASRFGSVSASGGSGGSSSNSAAAGLVDLSAILRAMRPRPGDELVMNVTVQEEGADSNSSSGSSSDSDNSSTTSSDEVAVLLGSSPSSSGCSDDPVAAALEDVAAEFLGEDAKRQNAGEDEDLLLEAAAGVAAAVLEEQFGGDNSSSSSSSMAPSPPRHECTRASCDNNNNNLTPKKRARLQQHHQQHEMSTQTRHLHPQRDANHPAHYESPQQRRRASTSGGGGGVPADLHSNASIGSRKSMNSASGETVRQRKVQQMLAALQENTPQNTESDADDSPNDVCLTFCLAVPFSAGARQQQHSRLHATTGGGGGGSAHTQHTQHGTIPFNTAVVTDRSGHVVGTTAAAVATKRGGTVRIPQIIAPQSAPFAKRHPLTVVLDLDETLICARQGPIDLRRGVANLIRTCKAVHAEIIVWTAGIPDYVEDVLDKIEQLLALTQENPKVDEFPQFFASEFRQTTGGATREDLDCCVSDAASEQLGALTSPTTTTNIPKAKKRGKKRWFHHLITRNELWYDDSGANVKDLRMLGGRSLDDIVVVENNPLSVLYQPENAILVEDFEGYDSLGYRKPEEYRERQQATCDIYGAQVEVHHPGEDDDLDRGDLHDNSLFIAAQIIKDLAAQRKDMVTKSGEASRRSTSRRLSATATPSRKSKSRDRAEDQTSAHSLHHPRFKTHAHSSARKENHQDHHVPAGVEGSDESTDDDDNAVFRVSKFLTTNSAVQPLVFRLARELCPQNRAYEVVCCGLQYDLALEQGKRASPAQLQGCFRLLDGRLSRSYASEAPVATGPEDVAKVLKTRTGDTASLFRGARPFGGHEDTLRPHYGHHGNHHGQHSQPGGHTPQGGRRVVVPSATRRSRSTHRGGSLHRHAQVGGSVSTPHRRVVVSSSRAVRRKSNRRAQ